MAAADLLAQVPVPETSTRGLRSRLDPALEK